MKVTKTKTVKFTKELSLDEFVEEIAENISYVDYDLYNSLTTDEDIANAVKEHITWYTEENSCDITKEETTKVIESALPIIKERIKGEKERQLKVFKRNVKDLVANLIENLNDEMTWEYDALEFSEIKPYIIKEITENH